jgi:hypothetical protein
MKVQLACDQEQNGPDGGEPDEASCTLFGGLEQSIECFETVVGLTGLGPSDDAFEMAPDHRGNFFHRFNL